MSSFKSVKVEKIHQFSSTNLEVTGKEKKNRGPNILNVFIYFSIKINVIENNKIHSLCVYSCDFVFGIKKKSKKKIDCKVNIRRRRRKNTKIGTNIENKDTAYKDTNSSINRSRNSCNTNNTNEERKEKREKSPSCVLFPNDLY